MITNVPELEATSSKKNVDVTAPKKIYIISKVTNCSKPGILYNTILDHLIINTWAHKTADKRCSKIHAKPPVVKMPICHLRDLGQ
jgi:hypothetical protein